MPSWVPDAPSGDAGINLKSDLEALADRAGPCNFTATTDPTASDDASEGYEVGSFWINTSTNSWFVCTNNTPSAAIWRGGGVTSVNARTGAVTLLGTDIPAFVASGSSHAPGAVPDPGSSAGSTRFLREDATWAVPSGGGPPAPATATDAGSGLDFSAAGSAVNYFATIDSGVSSGIVTLPASPTVDDIWITFFNFANNPSTGGGKSYLAALPGPFSTTTYLQIPPGATVGPLPLHWDGTQWWYFGPPNGGNPEAQTSSSGAVTFYTIAPVYICSFGWLDSGPVAVTLPIPPGSPYTLATFVFRTTTNGGSGSFTLGGVTISGGDWTSVPICYDDSDIQWNVMGGGSSGYYTSGLYSNSAGTGFSGTPTVASGGIVIG